MPTNILVARISCPACKGMHDVGLEFRHGALAGEEYVLGDAIAFQEEYSFYHQSAGDEGFTGAIEGEGQCEQTGARLTADILLEGGRIVAVQVRATENER